MNSPFLQRINRLLTPQRISYAWIAGGAMWLGWLVSIWLGPGKVDLARQVIGADFLQFYTAGLTLRQGESAQLYNTEFQAKLELEIAGPELQSYHAFITPPFLAWLFVPFALLPYTVSFAAWSLLGLLLLWLSLRWLGQADLKTFGMALTWYPLFAVISFGQNSLLSLSILSLTYALWRKGRLWQAGLVASLVLYKPQLALGIGLLWLLNFRRDWKALVGLTVGGGVLAGLCFVLLPDASLAYVQFARNVLPDLPSWGQFPLWHLHTVRGFFRLLLPETVPGFKLLADGVSTLLAILGVWAFYRFWRRTPQETDLKINHLVRATRLGTIEPCLAQALCQEKLESTPEGSPLHFAAAICLTIWITPHAMIYDWVVLLIPALLLWQHNPGLRRLLRPLFALIWVATFLSGPLTVLQMKLLPFAIQISVPVLAYVLVYMLTESYRATAGE